MLAYMSRKAYMPTYMFLYVSYMSLAYRPMG